MSNPVVVAQPVEPQINETAVSVGAFTANVVLGTTDAAVDCYTGFVAQREIRKEVRGSYKDRRAAASALLRAK